MNRRRGATLKLKKRLDGIKRIVNATFTDLDWLKVETDVMLEEYMSNGGLHPIKEIPNELSLMAALLAKTHENIERTRIKTRSRDEWEELECQFVPPIPLDIPEGYKVCSCWNCSRLLKSQGKRKFCSEKCRQEQQDANDRLKKTGTYMAPYRDKYRPKRDETPERQRIEKEVQLTEKMERRVPTMDFGINGKIKPKYIYSNNGEMKKG